MVFAVHGQQVVVAAVLRQVARAGAGHRRVERMADGDAARQRHGLQVHCDIVLVDGVQVQPAHLARHEVMHEGHLAGVLHALRRQALHRKRSDGH